jgi:hypothetical protein
MMRIISGDPTDIAHVLLGLALGLAAQEAAGWLGTSQASVNRRWSLGAEILLDGLNYAGPLPSPPPPN